MSADHASVKQEDEEDLDVLSDADEEFEHDPTTGDFDLRGLQLKKDHQHRPLFVTPDLRVLLEVFSPVYRQAHDLVIAMAEPVCRPAHLHEYRLTPYSLHAAASIGLKTEEMIEYLGRLCKTQLPKQAVNEIRRCTQRYGKVKLLLKNGKYLLQSSDPGALQDLLQDHVITQARVDPTKVETFKDELSAAQQTISKAFRSGAAKSGEATVLEDVEGLSDEALLKAAEEAELASLVPQDLKDYIDHLDEDDDEDTAQQDAADIVSFEIRKDQVEAVQRQCDPQHLDWPLLMDYDFVSDKTLPALEIDLKPNCVLRPYQEKSLRKMFGSGRARSGIIVLPCGAGKTLTGITAISTIKKRAIVLTTSNVAVEQWCNELKRWCNVDPSRICRFTSEEKTLPPENCVVCCTYSMLASKSNRAVETQRYMDWLYEHEFGIMILDEVQRAPANEFRQILSRIPAHCKLGLTATLVREDGKITDLRFLVGPKLYEANWMDLQRAGHIASVKCCEVWCPMAPSFYAEYLKSDTPYKLKLQLCVCNPTKFNICEFLIKQHEERKDKIIVFSDDIFALEELAKTLDRPFIHGKTPSKQRLTALHMFKTDPSFRTIFLSKIADNAFDLPEANVLIQVSSHGGSRRQEAQRLGRILRAKKGAKPRPGEYNAFFYTLVSQDTVEMAYATARQRFLVDQGYAYQVLTRLEGFASSSMSFGTEDAEQRLLTSILANKLPDVVYSTTGGSSNTASGTTRRVAGSMSALSGADDMVYAELPTGSGARSRGAGGKSSKRSKISSLKYRTR